MLRSYHVQNWTSLTMLNFSNSGVMQTCYSANQHWLFPFLLTTSSPPQHFQARRVSRNERGSCLDRLVDGKCCLLIVVKRLFHALRYYSALHNGSFVQKWLAPYLLCFLHRGRVDFSPQQNKLGEIWHKMGPQCIFRGLWCFAKKTQSHSRPGSHARLHMSFWLLVVCRFTKRLEELRGWLLLWGQTTQVSKVGGWMWVKGFWRDLVLMLLWWQNYSSE